MKKQYVPTTLDSFLNESKNITLKRKYGENEPIVVGSRAPLRNSILSYVNENVRVSKNRLKRFIGNLNESSKNPEASANMWLSRNEKFFLIENRNGVTYYRLSPVGKRLVKMMGSDTFETENIRRKIFENSPKKNKKKTYDFVDRTKGKPRPGIYDKDNEACEDEDSVKESRMFQRRRKMNDAVIAAPLNEDLENYDIKHVESDDIFYSKYILTHKITGDVIYIMVSPDGTTTFYDSDPEDEQFVNESKKAPKTKNKKRLFEATVIPRPTDIDDYDVKQIESDDIFYNKYILTHKITGDVIYSMVSPDGTATFYDSDPEDEQFVNENKKDDARLKRIIENLKVKNKKRLFEEDEEDDEDDEEEEEKEEVEGDDDELSFDDLDLDGDEEDDEEDEDEEDDEDDEDEEDDEEDEDEEEDEESEKVEITEFVITVDDVEEAIEELKELEVEAEQVLDEEGEPIEDQIRVSADYWEILRGWLEDKGVDIEEMFGGEIEVEDEEIEGEEEPEGEDFKLDFGEEGEDKEEEDKEDDLGFDLDLDFDLDSLDDLEDDEKEEDVEESVTGMEGPEKEKWPNLAGPKQVTINIK